MAFNTATSIVDYLKSKGLKPSAGESFPLYDVRTQLYNKMGLGTQLGEFRGSGEQNTALLNQLNTNMEVILSAYKKNGVIK